MLKCFKNYFLKCSGGFGAPAASTATGLTPAATVAAAAAPLGQQASLASTTTTVPSTSATAPAAMPFRYSTSFQPCSVSLRRHTLVTVNIITVLDTCNLIGTEVAREFFFY